MKTHLPPLFSFFQSREVSLESFCIIRISNFPVYQAIVRNLTSEDLQSGMSLINVRNRRGGVFQYEAYFTSAIFKIISRLLETPYSCSIVYDKNPRIPVAEQHPEYLRVRVSNIPLSADDERHKAKECQTPSKPASDNETPSKAAPDNEANKTDDQSDASESESGEGTDIGDHVDHSETPPSQSILQPTEAIIDPD
ncbi:Hypothetical predicted protein [Mytilus galloprovincialis]|uniref:Uncharacterized protein n=1 Tax=Mytilus galloprovincialis TaxID=29158 RepID=A0A8B6DFW1_MYTGA|nr:Hypothetical predicted protein [Mytilus galloprovincialis]